MTNQPDPRMVDNAQSRGPINPDAADSIVRSATTDGSYGESRHTHYVDPAGNQIDKQVEVYQDSNLRRANRQSLVSNVICFLLGVLEVILALRFFFRLLDASQDNSFTPFLYNLSNVFVAPFNGIFHDQTFSTGHVFELSTLITMVVFALIAWGLVALSRLIFTSNESGRQQVVTTRRSQR
jgi:hypothetical protein